MKIHFRRSEFLSQLFPSININNDIQLEHAIKEFYSYSGFTPKVKISNDVIEIAFMEKLLEEDTSGFHHATSLCAQGKFAEARPLFEKLIEKNPTVSEYYRNLAQTYEEEGQHEKAIDLLIDALKWDPKNHWALILMGNIYARYLDDVQTAMTYYDQVVEADPGNYIALNNIGGAFLQSGKLNLAERYLSKAYHANAEYPNITLGMGLLNLQKGDLRQSFQFAIDTLRNEQKTESQVYQTALKLALDSAQHLVRQQVGKETLVDFIQEIETLTGKEVKIDEDEKLPTAAKVEIAENHNRDYHKILHNPKYPQTDHLIAHELVHLKLAEEARRTESNMLFIAKNSTYHQFLKTIEGNLKKLEKRGIPETSIAKYSKDLFEGILRQVFNTPIDLFIEDFLYNCLKRRSTGQGFR